MLEERISLHELNNALTVIAGATHQLDLHLKNNLDTYVKDKLTTLNKAISRAVTITHRTRWDFATDKRVLDVSAQVKEMQGVLYMIARGRAALRINADGEAYAEADPVEVEGITINLVKNAVEATGAGSVDVAVTKEKCAEVCTTCGKAIEGYHVVIEVIDDGTGIPHEDIAKVFEQHYTTRPNGQGLGLFNLRMKVHLMGGHVTVSSSPEGTVFRVYLLPAKCKDIKHKTFYGIPSGRKAVVLAGNNGGSTLLNDYLGELNVKTIEPANYETADFIVYDSDINSQDARAVLKGCAKEHRDIPVICITNYYVGESVLGNTFFLTKPFDKDRFARIIRRAVNHAE